MLWLDRGPAALVSALLLTRRRARSAAGLEQLEQVLQQRGLLSDQVKEQLGLVGCLCSAC